MSDQPIKADNGPISDRLRALGIEPRGWVRAYERAHIHEPYPDDSRSFIQKRCADAALDEVVTVCEALYHKRLPCSEAEVAQRRYEQAEAERDEARRQALKADTAFGILSDLHPEDAAEAWRKAGELCEEAV